MKTLTVSRAVVRYARDLARSGIENNAAGELFTACQSARDGEQFITAAKASIRDGQFGAWHPLNKENLRIYRETHAALST